MTIGVPLLGWSRKGDDFNQRGVLDDPLQQCRKTLVQARVRHAFALVPNAPLPVLLLVTGGFRSFLFGRLN